MSETCAAGWCAETEWCGVTCTASVLDGKWQPVIIYQLLDDEPRRFVELADAADGISDRVLSDVLDDLRADGILDRRVVNDRPLRVEYALTPKGRELEPVVRAMAEWGRRHG